MENKIYIRDEFITATKISEKELDQLEREKLIKPVGFTEQHIPIYSDDAITRIKHIQKLQQLGYDLKDIQRIVKKVGLPKSISGEKKSGAAEKFLTVGILAERVGVSPRTIKHWEERGIIGAEMRSEGGFRLYPENYVFFCKLIRDLQLFGYSLEEIKAMSEYFREYISLEKEFSDYPKEEVNGRLQKMLDEIQILFDRMELLKDGIQRWEDLLKKKKKDILNLKNQNLKRADETAEKKE